MYRIGWPLWKMAARAGRSLRFRVDVHYDPETASYWASSDDIGGLVVAGDTLDEVMREAQLAADVLLELEISNYQGPAKPDIHIRSLAPA